MVVSAADVAEIPAHAPVVAQSVAMVASTKVLATGLGAERRIVPTIVAEIVVVFIVAAAGGAKKQPPVC
jgi:hypothetical protein